MPKHDLILGAVQDCAFWTLVEDIRCIHMNLSVYIHKISLMPTGRVCDSSDFAVNAVLSFHAVSLATAGFERLSGSWALGTAPY